MADAKLDTLQSALDHSLAKVNNGTAAADSAYESSLEDLKARNADSTTSGTDDSEQVVEAETPANAMTITLAEMPAGAESKGKEATVSARKTDAAPSSSPYAFWVLVSSACLFLGYILRCDLAISFMVGFVPAFVNAAMQSRSGRSSSGDRYQSLLGDESV